MNRFNRITDTLRRKNADIVCLQEVDHYHQHYKPFFLSMGYIPVYLRRTGREDGVLTAVKTAKFQILAKEVVQFDDLALATRPGLSEAQRERYRKQNVALILLLTPKYSGASSPVDFSAQCLTAGNAHLYWNPTMPYIKLAQTHYLLERIAFVRERNGLPPSASLLVGDFNSLPESDAYKFISKGIPIPNLTARWRTTAVERAHSKVVNSIGKNGTVRFVCDESLVRLARMLRLLGVDAALEERNAGDKSTKKFSGLLETARSERRVIITTSTWLLQRAECPEAFYIKSPKRKTLEEGLAELLYHYDVKLDKSDILSACAKCGGNLELCSTDDPRLLGRDLPWDRQLLICVRCSQVYWESGTSNGKTARARQTAERLLTIVQGFRDANETIDSKTCQGELPTKALMDYCNPASSLLDDGSSDALLERNPANRGHIWLKYHSAYATCHGREPERTNINGDFRGTLDYIFVAGAVNVLDSEITNNISGYNKDCSASYPNHGWPSDHMMLRATIKLVPQAVEEPSFFRARTLSSHF